MFPNPKSALRDCSGVLLYKSVKTPVFTALWKMLCVYVLYPECPWKCRWGTLCWLHLQKKVQNVEFRTKWRDYIHRRTRRGVAGAAAPHGLEKFQGKLCFQGKRKLLKNPECKKYTQYSEKFQVTLCFSG